MAAAFSLADRTLRRSGAALLDLVFPARCVACGRSTMDRGAADRAFCTGCESELPALAEPVCRRCAVPAPAESDPPEDCPTCREAAWRFDETLALGPYVGLLRHLILTAKRDRRGAAASALGARLAVREQARLAQINAAAVVPTPMHWARRLGRGVNSAERFAEGIAHASGVAIATPLWRVRSTAKQTEVAPSDRPGNVRGAFRARLPRRLAGATLLLADDVLTTGSTCSAAARELKRAGAGRVVAVVAARRLASR